MPGRSTVLVTIPDPFWQLPEVAAALRKRDIGELLVLVHDHTGASQTQIGIACGKTQPKINAIMLGKQKVEHLEQFEQYAEALEMPDSARLLLGLAPQEEAHLSQPAGTSRLKATRYTTMPVSRRSEADMVAEAAADAAADRLRLAVESGPESLELLHGESLAIARAANRPVLEAFSAARAVRRNALELAEQTHRPELLADLYAICGQATALMASSAFDLNRWDESDALAKAAVSYASLAGHASLQAWTYGLEASLAN